MLTLCNMSLSKPCPHCACKLKYSDTLTRLKEYNNINNKETLA